MNKKYIILIGVLLIANKASANPLAVSEARLELTRLSNARLEAKNTLDKARLAYKQLDRANDLQSHALKLLIKSDTASVQAERASQSSVTNGREINGYLSESLAPGATARLVSSPIEGS